MVFWKNHPKPPNQVEQYNIIRHCEKSTTIVLYRNTQQDLFDIFIQRTFSRFTVTSSVFWLTTFFFFSPIMLAKKCIEKLQKQLLRFS
jgi:hypothetical protein